MFDARLRPIIDPPLDRMARLLVRLGATANQLTVAGLVLGLAAAGAVLAGLFWLALVLVLANRLLDGLDGPVARAAGATSDLGGFLDITFDFVFYAAVPLAFVLRAPADNAVAGALLIASFYLNGAAFLAFAAVAARRGLETRAQGRKTIYYLAGLAEGAETVLVFALMCLLPAAFALIAMVFAAVCFVSASARIYAAALALRR
jgi:phosphatidylglycerophosphate synthase